MKTCPLHAELMLYRVFGDDEVFNCEDFFMRLRLCLVFTAFAAGAFSSPAFAAPCNPAAAICVGKECDTVGKTAMDYDQKNLIAWLKNDSGSLV